MSDTNSNEVIINTSALTCLSPAKRINYLASLLGKAKTFEKKDLGKVCQGLLLTYPRYTDSESRQAVHKLWVELFTQFPEPMEAAGPKIIQSETTKILVVCKENTEYYNSPAFDRLALLEWGCNFLKFLWKASPSPSSSKELIVKNISKLFDSLSNQTTVYRGLNKAAKRQVKRVLALDTKLAEYILDITLKNLVDYRDFSILGLIINQFSKDTIEPHRDLIIEAYNSKVIGSKTLVPNYATENLKPFFVGFVDEDNYASLIKPTVDRMVLRAPEVVMQTLIPMVKNLKFDVSNVFATQLVDQIISALQSSNVKTRTDSSQLFATLSSQSNDEIKLAKVSEKLTKALSAKVASWEHRQLLYKASEDLTNVNQLVSIANSIVKSLAPLVAKETHEQAMQTLMDSFSNNLVLVLTKGSDSEEIIKLCLPVFEKGLKSDKSGLRKAYVKALGSVIRLASESSEALISSSLPSLAQVVAKIQSAPLAASSIPLESYIALEILEKARQSGKFQDQLAKAKFINLTVPNPKSPKDLTFLVNDKILTKLSEDEEFEWFLRAFETAAHQFSSIPEPLQKALSKSHIQVYLTLNSHLNLTLFFDVIKSSFQLFPLVFGQMIISEIKAFIETNSPLSKPVSLRLKNLLLALFKESDESINQTLALDAFILANCAPLKPVDGSFLWISLITKAQLSVSEIVQTKFQSIFGLVQTNLAQNIHPIWRASAFEAVKMLTFIEPEMVGKKMIETAIQYLNQPELPSLTTDDVNTWKTPEGTLYKDPLKKGHQVVEDRNRKNYDFEKWEQEIRESIAKKKGTSKPIKLTKEEQELVSKQLTKETGVRQTVSKVSNEMLNGFVLADNIVSGLQISAIIEELPEMLDTLLSKLLEELFSTLKFPLSAFLLNNQGVHIWSSFRTLFPTDLSDLPWLLCMATLRSYDITVPHEWQGEPLIELISRLLFRLQVYSTRKKLTPCTFTYALPLIEKILYSGGVGFEKNKDAEKTRDAGHDDDQPTLQMEQVMLALEVLGSHCELGEVTAMPRKAMLQCLIHTANTQPKLYTKTVEFLLTFCDTLGQCQEVQDSEVAPLFDGLLYESELVRKACLQGLEYIDIIDTKSWANIWIERFDTEDKDPNADKRESELSNLLWQANELELPAQYQDDLFSFLEHDVTHVRTCAAKSFLDAAKLYPVTLDSVLSRLYSLYVELSKPVVPEYDRFGMLVEASLNKVDPYFKRVSVAQALGNIAPALEPQQITNFIQFMVYQESLGDTKLEVRQAMLTASLSLIEHHGLKQLKIIMPILQGYLDQPDGKSETHDFIREAVVVMYGMLAQNLTNRSEIPAIIDKLIQTLDTPSESVQFAVAECLPPLIRSCPNQGPTLIKSLLEKCLTAEKYAKRRGAAYGLSGVLKGTGILALTEYRVMSTLIEAAQSKKLESKQGAMFAFETLCELLSRLFEPYIAQILPLLLVCFSDGSDDVRRATLGASRVIMSKLSEYGVKLTLPSLLNGLDDYQWRTKRGAIELLGTMAYCAPKQLSVSLPTIVPRLIQVLNDSHHQVKLSANNALDSFTNVINNPEVRELMPKIMEALCDPDTKTQGALKSLLETPFVHYLDAPSLALIVPILQRGLRERSTDVKCKASQIVGNMASLTDQKDLIPYLPELIPDLKKILADPVPEARGTSAKSLGIIVSKLGEDNFSDMIPELLDTLRTETSSIDRSGAAQALSEILAGLDISRMEGLLPDILANTQSLKAHIREGFVTLLIYLPATFGAAFKPYLHQVLPPIINGLADESEYVRDASLRSAQIIITSYSDKAVDLLLPELQRGIFEPNWRIRQASAQLMGDLLFKLMGITVKMDLDGDEEGKEDDEHDMALASSEGNRKALLESLGKDRRDLVLSGLFIIRSDVSSKVRQVASAIWHMIVTNTPRTLKEVLPVFMELVLTHITSPFEEREHMSSTSLGEVVRKLGENGLKQILPILNTKLESDQFEDRRSATKALSEMINVLGKSDAADFLNVTTEAILKALCDESAEVRDAASKTFDTLHHHIGPAAVDSILPPLLDDLSSGRDTNALEALRCLVSVRPSSVLPSAIAPLVHTPITAFNASALTALIEVGGASLNNRLRSILVPLMSSYHQTDADAQDGVRIATETLLTKVNDHGIESIMEILFDTVDSENEEDRVTSCAILATFFKVNTEDLDVQPYVVDWLRILVPMYKSTNDELRLSATQAFSGLVKALDKGDLDQLVIPLRQTVTKTCKDLSQGTNLPGFCIPKAIAPFLSIYLQGLMHGTSDIKERSASAIGELVDRTSPDQLKPFVTQITGPLIRIIGERYAAAVRSAILDTLLRMLTRSGAMLKPFLPQLQRTFIKSLSDANSEPVRQRAGRGLSAMCEMVVRVDPLVTELVTGAKTAEDDKIRDEFVRVLCNVVAKVGAKVGDAAKELVSSYLNEVVGDLKVQDKKLVTETLASI